MDGRETIRDGVAEIPPSARLLSFTSNVLVRFTPGHVLRAAKCPLCGQAAGDRAMVSVTVILPKDAACDCGAVTVGAAMIHSECNSQPAEFVAEAILFSIVRCLTCNPDNS